MNTYTVTVKTNSNAFAAIQRFNPDALIELEDSGEAAETYTATSEFVLDALLDAAPGLIEWDETTQEEIEWLAKITGENREYWRKLFDEYGFDAVAQAFDYANERENARPDTYHAIKAAMWEDDFRAHLAKAAS